MNRTLLRLIAIVLLLCILVLTIVPTMQAVTGSSAALAMVAAVPLRPSVMPRRHPRIAHFMPYLKGDSLRAIVLAVRLKYHFIDQNVQQDGQGFLWVLHWGRWRKQWRWMWTGRYVTRRGKRIEERVRCHYRRDKINQLSTEQVSRLRSKVRGGTRPLPLRTHMEWCAARHIILCAEFKFTASGEQAAQVAKDAIETGCVVIVMRLSNVAGGIHGAFLTLARFAEVGICVALLPRGRKPVDWETRWVPLGIQKWGRWRRTGV